MKFSETVGTIMLFTTHIAAFALQPRGAQIDIRDCPGGRDAFNDLDMEFEVARKMISFGRHVLTANNEFAKAFFGPSNLDRSSIDTIKGRYKIMRRLATDKDKDKNGINFNMKCLRKCTNPEITAYTTSGPLWQEMILCPLYWHLPSTTEVVGRCAREDITIEDVKNTRARVLVHELAHNRNVKNNPIIMDYAYGVPNLKLLAKGQLSMTNKGTGKKERRKASDALENAETYALTVAAIYLEEKCKQARPAARIHL